MKKVLLIVMLLLLPLALTACASEYVFPRGVPAFFEGYTWEALLNLLLGAVFGLFPTFDLFQWVKKKFGWEGQAAHFGVMGFSILIAAVLMAVTGVFSFDVFDVSFGRLFELGAYVYAGAQVAYQRFKNS